MYYTQNFMKSTSNKPEGVNTFLLNSAYQRFSTKKFNPSNVSIEQYMDFNNKNNHIVELTKKIADWLTENRSAIRYKIFSIPKMTGGHREIKAPEDQLKAFMKEIKYHLENIGVLTHDSAYAYIANRDCKKSLQCHQNNQSNWFLKMDIEKFFDNCSPEVISRQLRKIYPFALMEQNEYKNFIKALCDLSCYNNELPQGTPLSPLITNWLMIGIDYEISNALARKSSNIFIYTRYADDLLISSKQPFDYQEIVELTKGILSQEETPFVIKDAKTRYGSKSGKNWNLGIMYNKDRNLTVGHKRKRRIKTMMFQFYQGQQDRDYSLELNGELAYLQNIEPEYYNQMMTFMNNKYRYDFKKAINTAIKQR